MTTQQTPQKRRITVIPPNPQLTERDIHKKHLRVAPYCRVSTDSEEQLNSYNAQIDVQLGHHLRIEHRHENDRQPYHEVKQVLADGLFLLYLHAVKIVK